ncbi:surfeit locus 1 family protein [Oxalobacteraceae bacterium GrIS 2.11]
MNTDRATSGGTRSTGALVFVGACALLLFAVFVGLGCWQIQRLFWKEQLILRVEQRVHAAAANAPAKSAWSKITAASDEYRHVRAHGVFLYEQTSKVLASTVLGRGYWLMTPLRTDDGTLIWINRGFIHSEAGSASQHSNPSVDVEVIGLLRISESGGAFLHHNDPDRQRWYSRDINALTAAHHLNNVAPYFIDAENGAASVQSGTTLDDPVPGLTVIAFNNNHLVYSVTWFALAAMVAGAFYYLVSTELKRRRGLMHS